ncbi:MAG: DUF4838 domain-containing protein [Tannerellaceae bacterium]|jgi:beta-glucosidase|nr:DUF4838 domain-containing protein [Tannerellaceae bacterium]
MKTKLIALACFLCTLAAARDNTGLPYKNPGLPIETRVDDLLSRMTLEEKFWQVYMTPGDLNIIGRDKLKQGIFGLQVHTYSNDAGVERQILNYEPGLTAQATAEHINDIQKFFVEETRLGIPIIPFDEALHGLIRRGSTIFPQAIALAATFDTTLMRQVASAISSECKSRGIRQILSPVVNLATDPRWGRVEETYGEDPYLSACMGVAFVSSFEQMGVITTPKHFVVNHGDGGRDSHPAHFSNRFMEETYYVPFKACFTRGKSHAVMTAYNTFDGVPCSASSFLLKDKLIDEWGFDGVAVSDANAVDIMYYLHHTVADFEEAGAAALNNGLHVIFQATYDMHKPYLEACRKGLVAPENLDAAVRRVLREKFRLGLFENPYVEPGEASRLSASPAHRELNLQAAQKSIVLLKNEGNALPLSRNLKQIAVLGQDAAQARLGGYSGPGVERISILKGIEKEAGNETRVLYAEGCRRNAPLYVTIPDSCLSAGGEKGLKGEYFNNIRWEGEPLMTRYDRNMRMQWTLNSPSPKLFAFDWYSVRWTGQLKAPASGTFEIGVEGNDGYALYIDNKKIVERPTKTTYTQQTVPFAFEKDKLYDIRLEFYENCRNGRVRLLWNVGVESEDDTMRRAVETARSSDVAIVVAGIEEAEFRDRAFLSLPGRQEELINRVAQTGVPTVVVLVGGSAITMDAWIERIPSVLDVWYPGDVGGLAVAGVLFGACNPGGKLPLTFPRQEGQLPLNYNHKPTGRGDEYLDLSGEPLFPFGHGLSYAQFAYSDLVFSSPVISPDENIRVSCKVTNTGKVAGDEVVQLYLHDLLASTLSRPINELKGFKRISLNPGETKEVQFQLTPEDLSCLDVNMERMVEPGDFRVMLGSSSKDIRLKGIFNVKQPVSGAPAQAQIELVKNGKALSRILIDRSDTMDVKTAELLQDFVRRITGAELEILPAESDRRKGDVLIGRFQLPVKDLEAGDIKEDGFALITTDYLRIIQGATGRGSIYGVVALLDDYFGVHCLAENVYTIHKNKDMCVPAGIKRVDNPAFRYRQVAVGSQRDPVYKLWHRLESPGEVFVQNLWVHTFNRLLPASQYGESHPEYYAYINGRRRPGDASQWCLANPQVFEIVASRIDSLFKAHPDRRMISVSQNDSQTHCFCDACQAIDEYEGSPSGTIIRFVNKLAERFPDKEFSTLAYLYSVPPPRHTKPLPNVNIMLCDIDCHREVPLTENASGQKFVKDMEGWAAISDNIFVWDYGINFDNYISPFPNLHVLQPNMQLFLRNKATMHFSQINSVKGGDFSELRAYLVAKLMWNTSAGVDSIMQTFLQEYYGEPAAFYLYQYIKLREGALMGSEKSLWIYDTPVTHKDGMLNKIMIKRYKELFDKAEQAVAHNQTFLNRVREARLPVMYAELEIARTEPVKNKAELSELLQLFNDRADEYHVVTLNERRNTVKEYAELYIRRNLSDTRVSLARDCPVTYLLPADSPYDRIAGKALTDGLYGGATFNESWVGWAGKDAEFIIDLKETKEVQRVEADFLHKLGSWILLPESITCSVSADNDAYQLMGHTNVAEDRDVEVKYVPVAVSADKKLKARYIKIKIETIGLCPPWHYGVGNPAWFFVDEINVY